MVVQFGKVSEADQIQYLSFLIQLILYMTAQIQKSLSSGVSPHPTGTFPSASLPKALTTSEVGKIVNNNFKEGEVVKGDSRINYLPYEKKVIEYEDKKVVKKVPVKKKVIEYQQHKYIEQIPREVTRTSYIAVEHIGTHQRKKTVNKASEDKSNQISFVSIEKQYSENSTSLQVTRKRQQTQVKSNLPTRAHEEYYLVNPPKNKKTIKNKEVQKPMKYVSVERNSNSKQKMPLKVRINFQSPSHHGYERSPRSNPYQITDSLSPTQ